MKKNDFTDFFTDNRGNKVKRTFASICSLLGSILFGIGIMALIYIFFMCAYACQ